MRLCLFACVVAVCLLTVSARGGKGRKGKRSSVSQILESFESGDDSLDISRSGPRHGGKSRKQQADDVTYGRVSKGSKGPKGSGERRDDLMVCKVTNILTTDSWESACVEGSTCQQEVTSFDFLSVQFCSQPEKSGETAEELPKAGTEEERNRRKTKTLVSRNQGTLLGFQTQNSYQALLNE